MAEFRRAARDTRESRTEAYRFSDGQVAGIGERFCNHLGRAKTVVKLMTRSNFVGCSIGISRASLCQWGDQKFPGGGGGWGPRIRLKLGPIAPNAAGRVA